MSNISSHSWEGEDQAERMEAARRSLLPTLEDDLATLQDFYQNLQASYDTSVYEQFEWLFISIRNRYKSLLMNYADPCYDFISRSANRGQAVSEVLRFTTEVAAIFQNARESNRLDRSRSTDAIENLIYALRNLQFLLER